MCVIVVVGVGQRIMSERRALGLNEKEWTIEFDHALRMREIRHHPWASVPKPRADGESAPFQVAAQPPPHHVGCPVSSVLELPFVPGELTALACYRPTSSTATS